MLLPRPLHARVALVLVRLAGMQRRGSSRVWHLPAATKALCRPQQLLASVAADKLRRRRKLRSRSHQRLRWLLMGPVARRRMVKMNLKMGMKKRTRYAARPPAVSNQAAAVRLHFVLGCARACVWLLCVTVLVTDR